MPDVHDLIDAAVQAFDVHDERLGIPRRDGIALRVLKVAEEAGEVVEALIGTFGQNPRKGRTHTVADVLAELSDVALTALVAARSLNDLRPFVFVDWRQTFGAADDLIALVPYVVVRAGDAVAMMDGNDRDLSGALHTLASVALSVTAYVSPEQFTGDFLAHVEYKTARVVAAVGDTGAPFLGRGRCDPNTGEPARRAEG